MPTDHSQETRITRSRKTDLNEKQISEQLKVFFKEQRWEYREEWPTKSGKAIDFLIKAPYDGGHIFFGVECKRDLNEHTNATILADYLEQASAYSKDLNLPVFLAPVFTNKSPSNFYFGDRDISRLAGLNIFGGRFNIGTLIKQERWWDGVKYIHWFMILRGGSFWNDEEGFNPKRLNMVCSTGSEKQRKELKVWK